MKAYVRSVLGEDRNRLDSWKEIAVYLGREVRTAQRWEKREGLPVKRHVHAKASSVYAFKQEVDAVIGPRTNSFQMRIARSPWLNRRIHHPSQRCESPPSRRYRWKTVPPE